MTCEVIKIGTSKGVRLPANLLKQMDSPDNFELEFKDNKLLLTPNKKEARKNWSESFKKMNENQDDNLLIDDGLDIDLELKWIIINMI